MELRKDYILDRWVIISEQRGARPREFKKEIIKAVPGQVCYFCPGSEGLTPPEVSRVGGDNWSIRVFPNKFPAVLPSGQVDIRTDNIFFTFAQPFGRHEVIVETPSHEKQLWDLSVDEIADTVKVYQERMSALWSIPETKYVVLFKNHGKEAGTSLVHSHSQMLSMNIVPSHVREEVEAVKKHNHCPYCDIINVEKGSSRRCFENDFFVAFTPYASRYNFEIWIFPKQHLNSIEAFDQALRVAFADILQRILFRLKQIGAPFNYFFHVAPRGEDLHFHVEVCPRLATFAGFELCTDAAINSVSPETAALFYRGE